MKKETMTLIVLAAVLVVIGISLVVSGLEALRR